MLGSGTCKGFPSFRRAAHATSVLLAAVALTACNRNGDPAPTHTATSVERVTIAVTHLPGSTPIFVAEEKGFFREEGLEIKLLIFPTGQVALEETLEGRADLATVGDTPFVRAVLEGKALKTIAVISENSYANLIVARRDRGISKGADLHNRRVGRVPWTTADFFLHVYLSTSYLNPEEIEIVDVPAIEIVDQLVEGRVDAVSTWPPYSTQAAQRLGTNAVILHDPDVYTMAWMVAVRSEWANVAPETLKKVLRALTRSARYMRQRPDQSQALYARRAKLEPSTAAAVWKGWRFGVSLDQSLILNLEDQARWILDQRGGRRTPPNFVPHVHAETLREIDPQAVQIPGS